MELAIINGTYRDTSKPASTQTTTASATRKSVSVLVSYPVLTPLAHRIVLECF